MGGATLACRTPRSGGEGRGLRTSGSEAGAGRPRSTFHADDGTFAGRPNSAPFVRVRVRSVSIVLVCFLSSLHGVAAVHVVDTAK